MFVRIFNLLAAVNPQALNAGDADPVDDPIGAYLAVAERIVDLACKGAGVRYGLLRASNTFNEDYCAAARALQHADLTSLSTDAQRLAFWINVYNLIAIHAVIEHNERDRITNIRQVFFSQGYNIGGEFYSLHDIEQGVLRANKGHPGIPGPMFDHADPRLPQVMPTLDPRIHFALVCAAKSCPPLHFYHAETVEAQLQEAAVAFVNGRGTEIDLGRRQIRLSKIFQWYAIDFGASPLVTLGYGDRTPLLHGVGPWIDDNETRAFTGLYAAQIAVDFMDYDWSLNAVS